MNLAFDEAQEELRSQARAFLSEVARAAYQACAHLTKVLGT